MYCNVCIVCKNGKLQQQKNKKVLEYQCNLKTKTWYQLNERYWIKSAQSDWETDN
jgi:hypothetical protein